MVAHRGRQVVPEIKSCFRVGTLRERKAVKEGLENLIKTRATENAGVKPSSPHTVEQEVTSPGGGHVTWATLHSDLYRSGESSLISELPSGTELKKMWF